MRAAQLQELANQMGSAMREQIIALWPEVSAVVQRSRLPLVNLALPALRQLDADQFQKFFSTLNWLIESDEQIVLFEFVLQKIIRHQLEPHFTRAKPPSTQYYTIKPLTPDCEMLLSALAHTGQTDLSEVAKAFQSGAPYIRAGGEPLKLLAREKCGLNEINDSLDRLGLAVPQIKKKSTRSMRTSHWRRWRHPRERGGIASRYRRNTRLPTAPICNNGVTFPNCSVISRNTHRDSLAFHNGNGRSSLPRC